MLYTITAQIDDSEYLIITPHFHLFTYQTLEAAKNSFDWIYQAIQNDKPGSGKFEHGVYVLVMTQPCIIKLDTPRDQLAEMIWSNVKNQQSKESPLPLIKTQHVLLPMQEGFIKKYQVLNILKDIESKPYADREGNIHYHHFMHGYQTAKNRQERIKQILREKGL